MNKASLISSPARACCPRLQENCLQYLTTTATVLHFLRQQSTFCNSTFGFPQNWRLRNKPRNSIQWLVTTLIWVVTCRHYTISMLNPQTSFRRENSGNVAKCRLFSQATANITKSLKFLNWMNLCPIPDSTLIPFQLNMKTVLTALPNPWKLIALISPLGVAGVMACPRYALVWV